jgi:tetratricopeptide (TPR) repeat protein
MRTINYCAFLLFLVIIVLSCTKSESKDAQTGNSSISIEFPKDLYDHNLKSEALESFLEIYYNPESSEDSKAEAIFYCGQISFDAGRFTTALNDWNRLIKEYPKNARALQAKENLKQLKEIFNIETETTLESSIARTYISNGDFWSGSKNIFAIDSSWLPKLELALFWYDKVISELPKSAASDLAYQRKLFALIGWGSYNNGDDDREGVKADFKKYMPLLLSTFNNYEKEFPNSSYLQGFRYQIAQAYWSREETENAKVWLNKIIDVGKDQPSFYTETAKSRLDKVIVPKERY